MSDTYRFFQGIARLLGLPGGRRSRIVYRVPPSGR